MGDEEYARALYKFDTIYAGKGVKEAVTGLGFKDEREQAVSEFERLLETLSPEEREEAINIRLGRIPRATKPTEEKPIFTQYNIQKGLGVLSTGAPSSALGIPLPVLESKKDHEEWAEKNWGPHWKTLVPEAIDVLNEKFGTNDLKPLSKSTMQQFLIASGGSIEEAKKLARQAGYEVE